ncbi:GNAT family N-acetyltransferase [Xanthobacter sp. YC-JY1]|uniref:GNAT family N-acetyltransferase n=1 Tax=Xanthobacter sp. YC-JY1 TaxID=2419844 RepID=UPI001F45BEA9|nr:GNAT family N-acetyltransferase [Xanthobacter sp. YC-JY1]UJX44981.1 N-acetyltransferase [Xanthobacter sp. YC-JY1]
MPDAHIRILPNLSEIKAADWDACAAGGAAHPEPFVSHAFLSALEESGCAAARTGWLPQHLVLDGPDGKAAAVCPAYLKSHSRGEYVFDQGWADAYMRAGGEYYPKVQVAVPFTPVTGRRLLLKDPDDPVGRLALGAGIKQLVRLRGASSAHVTFSTEEEWEELASLGFLKRTDRQFHWTNAGYATYDDFLAELASRKRKALKKERREAIADGISIEWLTGKTLTEEAFDAFFMFYLDTGGRKWGTPYLNRQFFQRAAERMADQILLVMARRNGRYIAGALNFIGAETLYGRYWGAVEHHPFLHFEVCYHQAIDYAIATGLKVVEAGAQGEHKLARGYLPKATFSAHYIVHQGLAGAVAQYLERERTHVEEDSAVLTELGPFRRCEEEEQD